MRLLGAAGVALASTLIIFATATCTQLIGVQDGQLILEAEAPVCPSGRASCGGGLCDTDITADIANCGACGTVCTGGNATSACVAGQCQLTCTASYADCDQNASTGCEVSLQTDESNCGVCGHDCLGAPCVAGACVPIVVSSTQGNIVALALDDTFAYVAQLSGPAIQTISLQSGSAAIDVASPLTIPASGLFAYQAPTVYSVISNGIDRELDAIPRDGLTPPQCLAIADGNWQRVAVDDAGVIWAGGTPLADSGATPLAREVPLSADCDASTPRDLALVTTGEVGANIAIDGTSAYVTTFDQSSSTTGALKKIDRNSGAVTVLLPRIRPLRGGSRAVVLDDTYVYWIDSAGAFVRRVPKAGCPTSAACDEQLYLVEFGAVFAIDVDDHNLYVLGSDNVVGYLDIVDKSNPATIRHVPSDTNQTSGDVHWNSSYVVWGLGKKLYRLSR